MAGDGADLYRSDLARDALSDQRSDQRTHALLPISIQPEQFGRDLEQVTALDTTQYSLFPIVTLRTATAHPYNPSDSRSLAPEKLDELLSIYTSQPTLDKREKNRIQQDTQRLVLDLVLSQTVVHSENHQAGSSTPPRARSSEIETPEDLFLRTRDLTLDEQPKIEIRHLIPREPAEETQPDRPGTLADKDPMSFLQSSSARQLLGEWQLGSNPSEYKWSGWRDTPSQPPTPLRRPVRPLPSPRTTQRAPQSRPTLGRYIPTIDSSSIDAPTFALPPTIRPMQTSVRSSPPPILQSSQGYPDIGPSTQVERGPFGGRPETKARKKPAKKRVGGF